MQAKKETRARVQTQKVLCDHNGREYSIACLLLCDNDNGEPILPSPNPFRFGFRRAIEDIKTSEGPLIDKGRPGQLSWRSNYLSHVAPSLPNTYANHYSDHEEYINWIRLLVANYRCTPHEVFWSTIAVLLCLQIPQPFERSSPTAQIPTGTFRYDTAILYPLHEVQFESQYLIQSLGDET
ncbi:hypothetical protein EAE99_001777 [Botrytis elliptica]|nr:hypothetical protein EAE99_001777 [Botrytis elliptica]